MTGHKPFLAYTTAALILTAVTAGTAQAASRDCEGGRWTLTQQGDTMLVRGRHVQFDVDVRTMTVRNWTLTGAANPGRLVTVPTVVFAEKAPLHGAILTQTERLRNDRGDLVFTRTNGNVSVKIQAKDCSQGGNFQMEVERDDDRNTVIRHTLAPAVFYYDNPNFRAREGDIVPFNNAAGERQNIVVSARVNYGSDAAPALVGRDSPQAATRIPHPRCTNPILRRDGTLDQVAHCGGVSEWDVISGGRMGIVLGQDATEVSPPSTFCVRDCQAQDQVRGGAVVLGHPARVPDASRLQPRNP